MRPRRSQARLEPVRGFEREIELGTGNARFRHVDGVRDRCRRSWRIRELRTLHVLDPLVVDRQIHAQRTAEHAARELGRSEEHTSELQSLMRISYAVFCLKKKNRT